MHNYAKIQDLYIEDSGMLGVCMDNDDNFEEKLARIHMVIGTKSDTSLAKILEIKAPSVAASRKRRQIPSGWIEELAKKFNVSADWLFFGRGSMHPVEADDISRNKISTLEKENALLKHDLLSTKNDLLAAKDELLILYKEKLRTRDCADRGFSVAVESGTACGGPLETYSSEVDSNGANDANSPAPCLHASSHDSD